MYFKVSDAFQILAQLLLFYPQICSICFYSLVMVLDSFHWWHQRLPTQCGTSFRICCPYLLHSRWLCPNAWQISSAKRKSFNSDSCLEGTAYHVWKVWAWVWHYPVLVKMWSCLSTPWQNRKQELGSSLRIPKTYPQWPMLSSKASPPNDATAFHTATPSGCECATHQPETHFTLRRSHLASIQGYSLNFCCHSNSPRSTAKPLWPNMELTACGSFSTSCLPACDLSQTRHPLHSRLPHQVSPQQTRTHPDFSGRRSHFSLALSESVLKSHTEASDEVKLSSHKPQMELTTSL